MFVCVRGVRVCIIFLFGGVQVYGIGGPSGILYEGVGYPCLAVRVFIFGPTQKYEEISCKRQKEKVQIFVW